MFNRQQIIITILFVLSDCLGLCFGQMKTLSSFNTAVGKLEIQQENSYRYYLVFNHNFYVGERERAYYSEQNYYILQTDTEPMFFSQFLANVNPYKAIILIRIGDNGHAILPIGTSNDTLFFLKSISICSGVPIVDATLNSIEIPSCRSVVDKEHNKAKKGEGQQVDFWPTMRLTYKDGELHVEEECPNEFFGFGCGATPGYPPVRLTCHKSSVRQSY